VRGEGQLNGVIDRARTRGVEICLPVIVRRMLRELGSAPLHGGLLTLGKLQ